MIRKILWEKRLLPKKVKKDKCDAFISLYQCPTVLLKSIPHVMVVHDIIPKIFPQYLSNFRKKLYWKFSEKGISSADKIVAVSHKTEKDLLSHYQIDPEHVAVSYVAADEVYEKDLSQQESERILRKYGLEKGYIYSGGGVEIRKNMEGVLRAYQTLLNTYGHLQPVPKLVISGKLMPDNPLATDVTELVNVLELKDHVKVLGYVLQEDLPAIYQNAVMFVYPSRYEGFGLPVLEAMHQGVPVITSKRSSLPEVGGDSVLYCEPDHIDDIVMVMKKVISSRELQMTLSMKGRDRAKKFSWQRFTDKMLHAIESQVKNPRR